MKMATNEEIENITDDLYVEYLAKSILVSEIIETAIKKGIQMERDKSNKYKIFYDHIKAHLKPNQEVICKICGKSAKTIWDD